MPGRRQVRVVRTPRFGLSLPQVGLEPDELYRRAARAYSVGFDSVWLTDHLVVPGHPEAEVLEAVASAAALAASVDDVRVGHLVMNATLRHPVLLAKSLATLDLLSGGRLEIGLGWGSMPHEMRMMGLDRLRPSERAARLAEVLEVLGPLLSGEAVDHDGQFFRIEGVTCRPTPVQSPIPLHIGGVHPELTMPLVARYADWWNVPNNRHGHLIERAPMRGNARISAQRLIGVLGGNRTASALEGFARRRLAFWGPPLVGAPQELVRDLAADCGRGVEMFIVHLIDGGDDMVSRFGNEVIAPLCASSTSGGAVSSG